MNASNMHTIKLDKYTALDTVLKLDWQKSKDKEYMVVKLFQSVSDCSTLFSNCRVLNSMIPVIENKFI